jgi:hypothetical protein
MPPLNPAEFRQSVLLRLYQLIEDIEAERLVPLAFDATAETAERGQPETIKVSLLVRRPSGQVMQPT